MASNTEKRITAKMVLDSTGYNDKLKGLNAEMKKHQVELKLASEGIKQFGRDSEKLKSVQESLTKQVEIHSKKVDLYKQSIEKSNTKMQENIKTRDKLKESLSKAQNELKKVIDAHGKELQSYIKNREELSKLNKEYEVAKKKYGENSTEAKKLKEQINKLENEQKKLVAGKEKEVKAYEKAKQEVEKTTKEYEKNEKAIETNAKQVQGYETNLAKANTQMTKAQGELNKVNNELDKSNNKWLSASEKLKDHSEKLKKTGSAVSGVGDEILKLSTPIAAAGIASTKLGTDFNEAMSTVSTLIPGQQKRLQDLKGSVQDVAIATGKSTDDIAGGTYQVISAFGDASDTMKKVEIDAKAATAGMATTTDALNLSSAVMKGYGDTTAKTNEKVMDMSFMTVKLGQTDFPSLASSIGKVVPLSNELKVSQEELFTVFATGTGVTGGAAEVSTQYRGILQSLMAPTTDMTKLIQEQGFADGKAMMQKKGLAGTIELITKKAKETNTPLQKYIGSIEGQTLALALAGEQSEVYKDKLEQMKHSQGAMNEAFKEQTEGINKTGFAYKQAMVKMQVAGQKMGNAMAPILEKGSELLTKLADKLGSLNKEQLESIAKWGMFSIATGGALKVVGGGISTVGNIAGGLSKLTGILGKTTVAAEGASVAAGTVGKGISLAGAAAKVGAIALNPWVLGIGAATLAGIGLYKSLQTEVVPQVDLFANKMKTSSKDMMNYNIASKGVENANVKISESTKKTVGAYMDLDKKVMGTIMNLYTKGTKITKDTAKGITDTYAQMGSQVKTGMDKHYNEQVKAMQNFFIKSKDINKKEQQDILNSLQQHNNKQKAEVDKYEQQIKSIMDKASKEKRALTQQEQQQINSIQEKMRTNAVKSLSDTEVESKVIMERLKSYSGRITTEQASEVIKNAERQRQGAVDKANKQYDQTVRNIIRMKDETGTITKAQADKMIKEAERQKDESISKANKMKEGVVKKVTSMNKDVERNVDTSTGRILTLWDRMMKKWDEWNPTPKKFSFTYMENKVAASKATAEHNWTGSNYFRGGLTYLHDSPGKNSNYELYDLPRGTRIYNHDASEELVIKTAENVATKVAEGMLNRFKGNNGINVTQNIYAPVPTPSEMARQSKNNLRELALDW